MDYHLYDNELDVIKNTLLFLTQVIFLIHVNQSWQVLAAPRRLLEDEMVLSAQSG